MRKTQFVAITMLLAFLVSFQNAYAVVKNRTALSPYIQADADSTYTFVGISHPSLTTAASQIGLTVQTVGMDTNVSTTFTISAGTTYRIFVVATNHSSVNNTTVTDGNALFLGVSSGSSQKGSLLVTTNFTNPGVQVPLSSASGGRGKFGDLGQLSMWGAIVIPSTSSGFAMEFIGDAHDSNYLLTSGVNINFGTNINGAGGIQSNISTFGRGIN